MKRASRRAFLQSAPAVAAALTGTSADAAEKLPRRILGRTGASVPILGFGTAPTGGRRELKEAIALYHRAIDLGVNYMDTAPEHTGYGKAQQQLGHVLKDRRKDVFLVTKCFEARGDAARTLLEKNLKELQTDYADLVYVHSLGQLDVEVALSKEGALPALIQAKKEGRIKHLGVSGHCRPGNFLKALQSEYGEQIEVMMNAVNLADRFTYNFEGKVWPEAARRQVALVAMKVFGGADYGSRALSNAMMPDEHRESAFRYALSLPGVSLAVIGMASEAELRQNIERARRFQPLKREEIAALETPGRTLARSWGAHFGPVA